MEIGSRGVVHRNGSAPPLEEAGAANRRAEGAEAAVGVVAAATTSGAGDGVTSWRCVATCAGPSLTRVVESTASSQTQTIFRSPPNNASYRT